MSEPVEYRALSASRGRNKTQRVSIPDWMLFRLGWNSERPIRIEMDPIAKSLTLTQVDPDAEGLVRRRFGNTWERKR